MRLISRFFVTRLQLSASLAFALGCLSIGQAANIKLLDIPDSAANAYFDTSRISKDGIALTLLQESREDQPAAQLTLRLHQARPALSVEPIGALGTDFAERAQLRSFRGDFTPAAHRITIKRRSRGWFVYIDEKLAASFPQRFSGPVQVLMDESFKPERTIVAQGAGDGGNLRDTTNSTGEASVPAAIDIDNIDFDEDDDDAYVQNIAPFRFADDFLVDAEDAEGMKLKQWDRHAGVWTIHSVTDDSIENPAGAVRNAQQQRQQQANFRKRGPQAERSPNFYCVEGSGSNALMVTGHQFYDRYTVAAAVHADEGENGIAFLVGESGKDFHAFTVCPSPGGQGLRFILWRTSTGDLADRDILAVRDTDLLPGQWHRLVASLHDDSVLLYVNGIRLAYLALDLPPGGGFGLFAHGPLVTRFDDVEAFSHEDIELADAGAFAASVSSLGGGVITRRRGGVPLPLLADEAAASPSEHIRLAASSRQPALFVVGAPDDKAHVLATAVRGDGRPFEVGLLAGWQGADSAALRFNIEQTKSERRFRLEWTDENHRATNLVSELALPLPPSQEPLQLMLDSTGEQGVRAYADGRLVLAAPDARRPTGAAGIYLPAGRRVDMALPAYRTARREYRSKVEKISAFTSDPYMRYWASPEGEWIAYKDGATWFRGDLFGAVKVSLPWKPNVRLHLAVPEDRDSGPYQILTENGGLKLLRLDTDGQSTVTNLLSEVSADLLGTPPGAANGEQGTKVYSVHLEGHALWIESVGRTLLSHQILNPPKGRRMRIEGMTTADLAKTIVERTKIADFLFTESLHEWTVNGGNWEVVNRFACDPRWSHLNGQNANSLAALWAGYEFEGDFNAELYAGMRHGWYDRPGDLNFTVMGSEYGPASGYSFSNTGWDVDESQLQSRLFRNGQLLASTDKYLVPRVREQSVRKGYTPLISTGRDVHGAWYHSVLRRFGDELQLAFDHEPVLKVRDPEPLKAGTLGIWTYRNSMVVARVRMSAEHIRPRPFKIREVPPVTLAAESKPASRWPRECADTVAALVQASGIVEDKLAASQINPTYPALPDSVLRPVSTNGVALSYWVPDTWMADDPVSNARLDWRPSREAPDTFVMTARQAGGSFFATNHLGAVRLRDIAGWRFETARTADASYNFHYTVGRMNRNKFQPAQSFFHTISGSDDPRGPMLRSGNSTVPPSHTAAATDGPWTEVVVWLPAFPGGEDNLWVRVDGFGNLNPSDAQQGLTGNLPGASYAIRNFAPVLLEHPVLETPPAPTAGNNPHADYKDFAEAAAAQNGRDILSRRLPTSSYPFEATAYWVRQPANLELTANWSADWPDVVEISSAIPWPVRKLPTLTATVEGIKATVTAREGNRLLVQIPRMQELTSKPNLTVELATSERRPARWALPVAGRQPAKHPVLTGLQSELFEYSNFESEDAASISANSTVRHFDPEQGTYLYTANNGRKNQRLRTILAQRLNVGRNPVIQFRARGEGLTQISLDSSGFGVSAVSEGDLYADAQTVRGVNPGITSRWETWTGLITDRNTTGQLTSRDYAHAARTILQSKANRDQTGIYSALSVDDFVAGPAVGPNRPLSITPQLFDLDGDGFSEWAILPGTEPWNANSNAPELEWRRADGGSVVTVPFDNLPDGVHHVLFRPSSPRGHGPITDIPFLLDRMVPTVSYSVEYDGEHPNANILSLRINTHGGSLPNLSNTSNRCKLTDGINDIAPHNGSGRHPLSYCHSSYTISPEEVSLQYNWAWYWRELVQQSKDGDVIEIAVDPIEDYAGNKATTNTIVKIPIDYAKDKFPPTITRILPTRNIDRLVSWQVGDYGSVLGWALQQVQRQLTNNKGQPPSILFRVAANHKAAASRGINPQLNTREHPLLALRLGFAKLPKNLKDNSVVLTFVTTDRKSLSFNLTCKQEDLPPEIMGKVDWSEGGTSEMIINLRDILARLSGNIPGSVTVTNMKVEFNNAMGAELKVHEVMTFAPWSENDELKVEAYDASGIKGVQWQGGGFSDVVGIKPYTLDLPEDDKQWLRLKVIDRAGNSTHTMHIPVIKVGDKLPGEPQQ